MGDFDDKQMVIIAATILAGIAMFVMAEPAQVVSNVITGLFGIAVGRTIAAR